MLQGPIGPFFSQLEFSLRAAGQRTHRIRFNGGDLAYSNHSCVSDFRGDAASWISFIEAISVREKTTDLVLFGDCRPLHRMAIEYFRARGLRIHVFEEGYLRPGWITLEEDGVNGYSKLNSSMPELLGIVGDRTATVAAFPLGRAFARRAAEDVVYTVATALFARQYPGYRTHKPWSALAEYWAGAKRFFSRPAQGSQTLAIANALIKNGSRFFLFPLQLDSDAQIRVHSPFGSMKPAIEAVLRSFAAKAPTDTLLVISEHPLDQAVIDMATIVSSCAMTAGVSGRVVFLRGGTPPSLLTAMLGMVTVNSTIGITALELGRPVAVLGQAIYRLAGLVQDISLDEFWTTPQAPDRELFNLFKRMLIEQNQLPGGYYSPAARRRAIEGAVAKLLGSETDFVSAAVSVPGLDMAAVGNTGTPAYE